MIGLGSSLPHAESTFTDVDNPGGVFLVVTNRNRSLDVVPIRFQGNVDIVFFKVGNKDFFVRACFSQRDRGAVVGVKITCFSGAGFSERLWKFLELWCRKYWCQEDDRSEVAKGGVVVVDLLISIRDEIKTSP